MQSLQCVCVCVSQTTLYNDTAFTPYMKITEKHSLFSRHMLTGNEAKPNQDVSSYNRSYCFFFFCLFKRLCWKQEISPSQCHGVTMATATHIIYSSVDSDSVDEMEHRDQNITADLDWEEQVIKSQNQKNGSNGGKLIVNYSNRCSQVFKKKQRYFRRNSSRFPV